MGRKPATAPGWRSAGAYSASSAPPVIEATHTAIVTASCRRFRNQDYHYLVNQLQKLGEGYRHNVDQNLLRFMGSFDDQDIKATADYLSRLRGPGAVHKVMRNYGVVVD